MENVKDIITGQFQSFCIKENDDLFVFGSNDYGQLGISICDKVQYPTKNENIKSFIKLSSGFEHSILLTHDNKVFTFGSNGYGQLGLDKKELIFSDIPQHISYFDKLNVIDVFCVDNSSYCLTSNSNILNII